MSDRWLFTLTLWGIHEAIFFTVWGGYSLMHRFKVAPRFRIAAGKAPDPKLVRRATREIVGSHALLIPILAWLVYPAWRWMGGDLHAPTPSWFELLWHLLVCILVQDTIFYWSHRLFHTKSLFRLIHRKHHDFRYIRGLVAEYAHPAETSVNLVALMAGPIVLAIHPLTFALWIAIRIWETVEAHSGYGLTVLASRHAYHHLYAARGCLGSFFGIWDRLMGTDAHWRQWRKQQTHR